MKVLIASDHAGFEMKKGIVEFLKSQDIDVEDMGPHKYDESDDYPDFIEPLALKISDNSSEKGLFGVILGGSGQGEAIVANRKKGVRAIVYQTDNIKIVELGREHNDANIISLSARTLTLEDGKRAVIKFITTPFSEDDRHIRRISKIDK